MTSSKSASRPRITEDEVRKNFKSMIDEFTSHNPPTYGRQFQKILQLKEVQFEEGIVGRLIFVINIPNTLRNAYNIAHGGAIAAIIDDSTWATVYAFTGKYMYSMKLITEFISGVPIETDLIFEIEVTKVSKTMAFTEAIIKDAKTMQTLGKGANVMAMPPEKSPKL
ncbi:UNKNOWN [Stylonychia lemnae]|uniref:Thioesterase domain-containing protein n=1 Tax=Stylonychia lemnae TaxID=5949 RepID=A0A077ZUL5_STYLE|nr:UNKNOWN [Stylonychia lemnae]|eukprot:CDW73000.1 UNKNOWN [Stylonychia lemnae]